MEVNISPKSDKPSYLGNDTISETRKTLQLFSFVKRTSFPEIKSFLPVTLLTANEIF
jgi:hypothetical protein